MIFAAIVTIFKPDKEKQNTGQASFFSNKAAGLRKKYTSHWIWMRIETVSVIMQGTKSKHQRLGDLPANFTMLVQEPNAEKTKTVILQKITWLR